MAAKQGNQNIIGQYGLGFTKDNTTHQETTHVYILGELLLNTYHVGIELMRSIHPETKQNIFYYFLYIEASEMPPRHSFIEQTLVVLLSIFMVAVFIFQLYTRRIKRIKKEESLHLAVQNKISE